MSTTSLVSEFLVVGLIPVSAIIFAVLSIMGIYDLSFIDKLKDYLTPLTLIFTLVVYSFGAVFHRLSQVLASIKPLKAMTQKTVYKGIESVGKREIERRTYVEQWGSEAVVRKIEYNQSLIRVFSSVALYLPFLGISSAIWLYGIGSLRGGIVAFIVCIVISAISLRALITQQRGFILFVRAAERIIRSERERQHSLMGDPQNQ